MLQIVITANGWGHATLPEAMSLRSGPQGRGGMSASFVPRATARAQRGKEARGFRRVRKPAVNSVVAVVFSYVTHRPVRQSWGVRRFSAALQFKIAVRK